MNYQEINKMIELARKNQLSVDNNNASGLLLAYGLDIYLEFYLNHRTSPSGTVYNHDGYHTVAHDFNVVLNAFEIAVSHELTAEVEKIKLLLLGALFHDFWHTQCIQPAWANGDMVNIGKAQNAWAEAHALAESKGLAAVSKSDVCDLISATLYPRTRSLEGKTLASILCDADLFGFATMPTETAVTAIKGLVVETSCIDAVAAGEPLTEMEALRLNSFFEKQDEFRTRHSWNTSVCYLKAISLDWKRKHRHACAVAREQILSVKEK